MIISFTKRTFVERDLIFIKPSFILYLLYLFFYLYLGKRVYVCWEWTDFCTVRWLAVSEVQTLCAIFLERRAAPPHCVFVYAMFSPVYLLSWPCTSCYLVIGSVALPVSASLHSLRSLFSCCCQLSQVNYFCVFALFCFIFPIMGLLLSHHVWLLSGLLVNFFVCPWFC